MRLHNRRGATLLPVVVLAAFGVVAIVLGLVNAPASVAQDPVLPVESAKMYLQIQDGAAEPPPPYLLGNVLHFGHGLPTRELVCPGETQACSYIGIAAPRGHQVLYHVWYASFTGPPQRVDSAIRLIDVETGQDRLLASRAMATAWSRGGRIAYVQQIDSADARAIGTGLLIVQDSVESAGRVWATDVSGAGLVWAEESLVASRRRDAASRETWSPWIDGPGMRRTLAPGATWVAVSSSGTDVLVTHADEDPSPRPLTAIAQVLRVSDGAELARFALPPLLDLRIGSTWDANYVVAAGSSPRGGVTHPDPTIVVLALDSPGIAVEQYVCCLGPGTWPMYPLRQPRFLDATHNYVGGWLGSVYLVCRIHDLQCVRDRTYSRGQFVENPSRP